MIVKLLKHWDNERVFAVLFTDLSKCICGLVIEHDVVDFACFADCITPYTYGKILMKGLRNLPWICLKVVNSFTIIVSNPIQEYFSF